MGSLADMWCGLLRQNAGGEEGTELCQCILDAHPELVNEGNQFGETLLFIAAEHGNVEMCRLLIARGADVCVVDNNGDTALIFAAHNDRCETCDFLLAHGADISCLLLDDNLPISVMYGNDGIENVCNRYLSDCVAAFMYSCPELPFDLMELVASQILKK